MKKNKILCYLIFLAVFLSLPGSVKSQETPKDPEIPTIVPNKPSDRFEIGIHYSSWSLNLIKGILEDEIGSGLGDEIRDEITKEIEDLEYALEKTTYDQELLFDSGGRNYGLELRYYPRGRHGPFSIGVSFEKTHMSLSVDGSVRQNFADGSFATADAVGEIALDPFFSNLTFRWDLFPEWRVTPYLIFGAGIADLNGEVSYNYSGQYSSRQATETIEEEDTRTLKEAEEEMDANIPNILPLFQLNLGIRAEIIPHLYIKAGAGFFDGFILRAGISGRF